MAVAIADSPQAIWGKPLRTHPFVAVGQEKSRVEAARRHRPFDTGIGSPEFFSNDSHGLIVHPSAAILLWDLQAN